MVEMVTLKARWGNTEFDILIEAGDRSSQVLGQISDKTGVPKEKIKVIPSSVLNPSFTLKEGMRITVMGTPEDKHLSAEPSPPQTRFVEDMTAEQIAIALREKKAEPLPVGLENLGNTCYLNAVIQCLVRLCKFRQSLAAPPVSGSESNSQIYSQLSALLSTLKTAPSDYVCPTGFVASVRSNFPQFNQRDSHGHFAQQDADEFFRSLVHALGGSMDSMFTFHTESKWRCLESDEAITQSGEELKSLTCHMGTQLDPVNHLHEGIGLSLKEIVEKSSSQLNRSAKFEKKTGLSLLPLYLMVQLARFQWKAKSDSAGTQATKTKIIRKVTFQKTLDVYDFCTDAVKSQLDTGREKRRQLIEAGSLLEDVQLADTCENDPHKLPTGVYELVAIVSHQGRTSDGGHYVGWTKKEESRSVSCAPPPLKKHNGAADSADSSDVWLKFDDDVVSETSWTAMTETGGMLGGLADSQMAYLLFYARTSVTNRDI